MNWVKSPDILSVHKVVSGLDSSPFLCDIKKVIGWLVGCFGFNSPLRQYFSLYRAVSQREGEREEKR